MKEQNFTQQFNPNMYAQGSQNTPQPIKKSELQDVMERTSGSIQSLRSIISVLIKKLEPATMPLEEVDGSAEKDISYTTEVSQRIATLKYEIDSLLEQVTNQVNNLEI